MTQEVKQNSSGIIAKSAVSRMPVVSHNSTIPGFLSSSKRFVSLGMFPEGNMSGSTGTPGFVYEIEKATGSLSASITDSPIRYSIMKSHVQRFPNSRLQYATPLGPTSYEVSPSYSHRIGSAADKGRRSSPFRSSTERFSQPKGPMPDIHYRMDHDVRVWNAKGFAVSTVPRFTEGSQFSSDGIVAGTARVSRNQPPDYYDIDQCGEKKNLSKAVEESPLRYSNLKSKAPRFPDQVAMQKVVYSDPTTVGPATYDPRGLTIAEEKPLRPGAASAFASRTKRFNDRPYSGPEGNFNFSVDRKAWLKPGFPWSTQERFDYIPRQIVTAP